MSRVEGHDARGYHWRLGWHGWIDGRWELMGKSCYYTIELTLKLVILDAFVALTVTQRRERKSQISGRLPVDSQLPCGSAWVIRSLTWSDLT